MQEGRKGAKDKGRLLRQRGADERAFHPITESGMMIGFLGHDSNSWDSALGLDPQDAQLCGNEDRGRIYLTRQNYVQC